MKRPVVGLLIQTTTGYGGERVFNDIAMGLRRRGRCDVVVVTVDETWSHTSAVAGLPQLSLRRRHASGLGLAISARSLSGAIRSLNMSAVVSFMTYANLVSLAAAVAFRDGARRVITEHTELSAMLREHNSVGLRPAVRALYPRAQRCLAVSSAVSADLARNRFVGADNIQVVGNPVDIDSIVRGAADSPAPTPRAVPATHAQGDRRLSRLVCVGSLKPAKGFDVAIRALSSLPNYVLDIIGDGSERTSLEALARSLGVIGRVRFLGRMARPYAEMAKADLAIQPSYREGFGIAAVEAAVLGIPVIASRTGGLAEMIPWPVPGILAQPGDASSFAAAILEARARSWPPVGDVRRAVAARFDADRVAELYEAAAIGPLRGGEL